MWTLTLHYADGTSEDTYAVTREDAREYGRYYRTHCIEGHPKRVVSTTITRGDK